MTNTTITCDSCGEDLRATGPAGKRDHITLAKHTRPGGRQAVGLPNIPTPLSRGRDFCSPRCLREWLDKHFPDLGGVRGSYG